MDPITILSGIKLGLSTGRSVAALSKEIGKFFDATDTAKKTLQKKGVSSKSTNATALDRWAKVRQAAEAESELQEWITQTYGRSKWLELLRIRKEVLQEKREAEAQATLPSLLAPPFPASLPSLLSLSVLAELACYSSRCSACHL